METEPCARVASGVVHASHGYPSPGGTGFSQCPGLPAPDVRRCVVLAQVDEDDPSTWMQCILVTHTVGSHAFDSRHRLSATLQATLETPERAGREGESQPLPVGTDEEDTQAIVIRMVATRRELGIKRYGQPLQPSNGRDSLLDGIEEALDLLVYLVNFWRALHPDQEFPL